MDPFRAVMGHLSGRAQEQFCLRKATTRASCATFARSVLQPLGGHLKITFSDVEGWYGANSDRTFLQLLTHFFNVDQNLHDTVLK